MTLHLDCDCDCDPLGVRRDGPTWGEGHPRRDAGAWARSELHSFALFAAPNIQQLQRQHFFSARYIASRSAASCSAFLASSRARAVASRSALLASSRARAFASHSALLAFSAL